MKNTIAFYQKDKKVHAYIEGIFPDLVRLKKASEVKSFNEQLLKVMPELECYVQKQLNRAVAHNQINNGEYVAGDFIDLLFIEVYDHFDQLKDGKDLHLWMFKKVDELLEDVVLENEFDSLFFNNIDDYTKPEWDAMEEKFSTDGDGDLVMLDEMDYSLYNNQDYLLNHVFIEQMEKEFTDNLDKQLEVKKILKHTELVLHNFPMAMQRVFELFAEYHFTIPEIAQITKRSDKEVESLLEVAHEMLTTSFLKRYETNIK